MSTQILLRGLPVPVQGQGPVLAQVLVPEQGPERAPVQALHNHQQLTHRPVPLLSPKAISVFSSFSPPKILKPSCQKSFSIESHHLLHRIVWGVAPDYILKISRLTFPRGFY